MLRPQSLTAEWVIGAAMGFLVVTAALILADVQRWHDSLWLKYVCVAVVHKRHTR